jgi:glutathione S-transferase
MKLYYHPASTTSRIVMLFGAQEAPELSFQLVDLFTGEHLQPGFATINPSCLVPVLEDGDFRLTECSAIVKYLADKKGSASYPQGLRERARVNELMDWFTTNFYRDFAYGLVYPQLFPHHRRRSDEAQAATVAWGLEKTRHWLRILDASLLGPDRPFLCGDRLTIADYLGAEMVDLGAVIRCDLSPYPNVVRWLRGMKELEGWAKTNQVFYDYADSQKATPFVAV